jgi:hypothetical protein
MSYNINKLTLAKPPKAVNSELTLNGTLANAGKKCFAKVVFSMISKGNRCWQKNMAQKMLCHHLLFNNIKWFNAGKESPLKGGIKRWQGFIPPPPHFIGAEAERPE